MHSHLWQSRITYTLVLNLGSNLQTHKPNACYKKFFPHQHWKDCTFKGGWKNNHPLKLTFNSS